MDREAPEDNREGQAELQEFIEPRIWSRVATQTYDEPGRQATARGAPCRLTEMHVLWSVLLVDRMCCAYALCNRTGKDAGAGQRWHLKKILYHPFVVSSAHSVPGLHASGQGAGNTE